MHTTSCRHCQSFKKWAMKFTQIYIDALNPIELF